MCSRCTTRPVSSLAWRTLARAMGRGEVLTVVDTPPGDERLAQSAVAGADAVVVPTRAGGVEYSRVAVRHRGHPLVQPRILDDTLVDPGAVPTVFAVARLDASFDRKPFGRIVAVRVRSASTLRPHACFRSSESTSKVRERSERRSRHISLQEVLRGALQHAPGAGLELGDVALGDTGSKTIAPFSQGSAQPRQVAGEHRLRFAA